HPAVRQGKRAWSYAQLHSAADTVTGALAALAPGPVVAVTGARTFGLVAAVVGVLHSQAVLLTLDPELPASRRGLMLAEAGARVLLVVGDLPIHETTPLGCDVVRIDPDTGRVAGGEPLPRGPVSHAPDDPAYVFFTSGSTGTPKAVLGRRCGLAHFLAWQRETFRVGPGDRVAQLTGLSFDVILRDLLLPLCSGATLCLPREEERSTHPRLLEWLRREQVTLLHLVPSLARAWLGSLDAPLPLPALRCVFFAGEPLTDQLVRRWREQLPGAPGGEIINLTRSSTCMGRPRPPSRSAGSACRTLPPRGRSRSGSRSRTPRCWCCRATGPAPPTSPASW
ncbi:MAG: lgrB, partial [Armatimonadetes bacterium]|nr:lgrB [Armatimonadota bacterium]